MTFSTTTNSAVLTAFAPAVCYDPERDCFWAMDISSGAASLANRAYIWKITWNSNTNLQCERITLTGTAISQSNTGAGSWNGPPRGGYGKLGVLRGWDALAVINRANEGLYVIKKPA